MRLRKIAQILKSVPTLEGAGVKLKRAFGYREVPLFDPFLMLDHFQSGDPADFMAGFPWHPHRGIETVTYLLDGRIEHRDSLGNRGVIGAGDVQWMTAGSGVIHQEMPQKIPSQSIRGFQLWTNLPASHKMMPPRYRDVKAATLPEVALDNGVTVKIISGAVQGVAGPVRDIITDPVFLDVTLSADAVFEQDITKGHTAFAYVLEGSGQFGAPPPGQSSPETSWGPDTVILYQAEGEAVSIQAGPTPLRFLFLSGKPLGEPVAWEGPIVMNTPEELRTAFAEYQNGSFIKQGPSSGGI